jgi:hypothetical protein
MKVDIEMPGNIICQDIVDVHHKSGDLCQWLANWTMTLGIGF